MVEVVLQCVEGHEFKVTFDEPVNWAAVNAVVKDKEPRCAEHPVPFTVDWYDC